VALGVKIREHPYKDEGCAQAAENVQSVPLVRPLVLEEEPAKTDPTFSKTKCEKVGHPGNPCGWVVGVEGAPPTSQTC